MCNLNLNFKKWCLLLQALFVYIWMTVLNDSDSRVGIYVLCTIAAVLILHDRFRYDQSHALSCGKSTVSVWIFSALFSIAVALANYPIFLEVRDASRIDSGSNSMVNALRFCAVLVGGFFVGRLIISYVLEHFPRDLTVSHRTPKNARIVFWISFFILSFIYGGYLFLTEYPGNLTSDSVDQILHVMSNQYDTMHPFWHTMVIRLCLYFGNAVFGNLNAGAACYSVMQLLVMSACLAYLIMTLYEAGIPGWCVVVSLLGYAVIPYHIAYSITMWKDIPFSLGILLFVTALFRCLRKIGGNRVREYILFVVSGFLIGLMRTNGVASFAIFLLIMGRFLWKMDRKILIILTVVLLVCVVLCGPVIHAFQTYEHPFAFLETLSVPLQQVARVIVEGKELTPEQIALVDQMIDSQMVVQEYSSDTVDPLKHTLYASDPDVFTQNKAEYIRLWVDLGRKYPMEYLKAWVDETKGYWNGGYRFRQYSEIVFENELGLEKTVVSDFLWKCKVLWFGFVRFTVVADVINSIGLHVWLMFLCWLVNLKNRKKEVWLSVPFIVILVGLWIGTPVYAEFRYVYPMIVTMPLLLCVSFFNVSD